MCPRKGLSNVTTSTLAPYNYQQYLVALSKTIMCLFVISSLPSNAPVTDSSPYVNNTVIGSERVLEKMLPVLMNASKE